MLTRSIVRCIEAAFLLAIGTSLGAQNVAAQGAPQVPPAADSVFTRARRLVSGGNGAAGRVLIDSMLAAAPPDSPTYADALYWRAALAASPADAERDYRRLVVDYPFASHLGDALVQLAQMENARGDRAAAAAHLQRYMLEAPSHPDRARVGLMLVRLLFDLNDVPRGCTAWKQAMSAVPAGEVELRNQLSYYSARCTANDVSRGSRLPVAYPPGATPAPAATKDTTAASGDSASAALKGRFTLQIAAYQTKAEATRLVTKLAARGLTARVVGSAKLYRVRIGRYDTRAAALAAQTQLKAKKLNALVTEIGPDDK
jgi:cell division septation protein DedD